MSIESVMPFNHLCDPILLLPSIVPSIRVFSKESVLHIRGQSIGVSASASVLPMNTQDWSPLGWTGWISQQCKGLSRVFSNQSALHIRWPKYWSFSFNISPSNEYSGLVSFRMDWLDLLAVQGALKSLLQHHSSKASILRCSAFFTV